MNELLELFAYNAWANRRMFDAAGKLPDADYLRDLKSSHGGVHGTLAHIVWAEHLWLNRWLIRPKPAVAQGADLRTLAEVRTRWEAVEAERGTLLAGMDDAALEQTRAVKPSSGGEYVHTFREMFRHLINHSAYHRGQVVTLLRQLGATPPNTDLITFYRR